MTPTQIAGIVASISALSRLAAQLVELLDGQEISEEQRAQIRTEHEAVQERIEALTPVPAPPG